MLVRSEIRWLYRDVTRQTKNCSVWSVFESVLPLWWGPAHLSQDSSGGSATPGMLCTEEQPSVGSNRHMGSSFRESFPMSEQVHLWGDGLFVQMDEALPVLRLTRRIKRRWFSKSNFLALNFQESCLVVKAHTSQDNTNRKCLSELRVKPPGCYSIPSLEQWPSRNI